MSNGCARVIIPQRLKKARNLFSISSEGSLTRLLERHRAVVVTTNSVNKLTARNITMRLITHIPMIPKDITPLRLPEQPIPSHLLSPSPINPTMIDPRMAVNSRSLTMIGLPIAVAIQSLTMLKR